MKQSQEESSRHHLTTAALARNRRRAPREKRRRRYLTSRSTNNAELQFNNKRRRIPPGLQHTTPQAEGGKERHFGVNPMFLSSLKKKKKTSIKRAAWRAAALVLHCLQASVYMHVHSPRGSGSMKTKQSWNAL